MKRRKFFNNLGLGVGALVTTPILLSNTEVEVVEAIPIDVITWDNLGSNSNTVLLRYLMSNQHYKLLYNIVHRPFLSTTYINRYNRRLNSWVTGSSGYIEELEKDIIDLHLLAETSHTINRQCYTLDVDIPLQEQLDRHCEHFFYMVTSNLHRKTNFSDE